MADVEKPPEPKPQPQAKPRTPMGDQVRMIILVGFGALLLNGAFFVLSHLYFKAHEEHVVGVGDLLDTAAQSSARLSFALLSAIVAVCVLVAEWRPREVGHALASLLGMASLAASVGAFERGLAPVMGVTLLIVGVLMPLLAWGSWHKSRASWAFLVALVAVFGGVDLFGAPKVRGLLGVGLWSAMILPALQGVTVFALASIRRDYKAAVPAAPAAAAATALR